MRYCTYAENNSGHHDWADASFARFDDAVFCQCCGVISRVLMPSESGVLTARWEERR
jgi:hypothetical protein